MDGKIERSFNVGILGENQDLNTLIGQVFGAPGMRSDLQFFNRLDTPLKQVFCAVTPIDYPDKIKPLLQTLMLTDIYVLVLDMNTGLNPTVGELLIGIDLFNQMFNKKTIITINNIEGNQWKLSNEINKLKKIIKTTSLDGCDILELKNKTDFEDLKKKAGNLGISLLDREKEPEVPTYTKLLIDHVFPVKGIGPVALAIIKKGILKRGEMLELVGNNTTPKKIIVKNIQKQDRNLDVAYKNDRVGIALKGVKPNEVNRDFILTSPNILKKESEIEAKVYINKFFNPKEGKITPGKEKQYYGLVDLRLSPLKFMDGDEILAGNSGNLKMKFDKPLFHDGTGLKGIVTELNKFENKNRIVGYFEQKI
ncbi:MAG: hypothetical protein EU547_04505 [Promethearchaeota archaeon]|nr:MAG: hypothetical protein EU547_04505 [Candidatus Lokiarchaeota archaeon]